MPLAEKTRGVKVLPVEKQIQIVSALVEGNSIRTTARMISVEHKTVTRVLLRVGDRCGQIMNERMRRLPCRVVQVGEIWTYVGKHEGFVRPEENRLQVGDQYVAWYNFCRIHSPLKATPAMESGISDHIWQLAEVGRIKSSGRKA